MRLLLGERQRAPPVGWYVERPVFVRLNGRSGPNPVVERLARMRYQQPPTWPFRPIAGSEREAFAHRQWHEAAVEGVGECRHSAPSGAVAGGDDREVELPQRRHRIGDNLLVRTREMKPADHAMASDRPHATALTAGWRRRAPGAQSHRQTCSSNCPPIVANQRKQRDRRGQSHNPRR